MYSSQIISVLIFFVRENGNGRWPVQRLSITLSATLSVHSAVSKVRQSRGITLLQAVTACS